MQEIAAHFSSSHNIHISPDFPSVLIYHFHKFFTVLSNFEGKMDGNFYSETYTYREGRILIYKRPNSKNFQCRLRVKGIKGYTIKSCDTSNLGEAVQFAEDLYDNLRFKKLNNLPLKTKTFKQIFDEWFQKADKSEDRQEFYQGRAKLYWFPYFGNYKIAAGGLYKEYKDQKLGKNTISESIADLKADAYGIYKGIFNSKGNCDELVQEKYKKHFGK